MNFALSSTYQNNLTSSGAGNNGVYVNATAFDGNGNFVGTINLISNGVMSGTSSLQLTNGTTLTGGNVVITVQQTGGTIAPLTLNSSTTIGSLLNTGNATASNYRYDAIEVTLLGEGSDVADLTNIVQFGAPMSLSVSYSGASGLPTDTRGYAISGQTLINDLIALSPSGSQNYSFAPGSPLNQQRETLSLANNVNPNPLNVASDWNSYVTGFQSVTGDVYLAAYFNGVSGGPGPSLSYYNVAYDSSAGVFWLNPVALNGISTTNYSLRIPATQTSGSQVNALTQNIYTQGGTLDVYTAQNGTLVQTYNTFTPNNAYGNIAKYLVAGFDAGFWGGSANSANPLSTGKIDLNQTWNWGANYAYAAINAPAGSGSFGYTNSIGTGTGTVGDPARKMYYDPFAAEFFKSSNAYGYSYSDLISNGGGVNPGISVYDPGTKTNVTAIDVKLFDLSETPTGYKPPTFNYVAPTGSTYSPAATATSDQFLFDFSLAGKYAPVSGTPMAFRFYAPGQAQAGSDGFVTFNLPVNYNQIYSLTNSGGQWTLTANASSGAIGYFNITGAPMTSDGSTSWYQIVLGTGSSAKTYNIYAHGTASTVTSAVIDGGAEAQLIPGQANQVKFSFNPGGSITFDPAYFASSNPTPPTPPPQNLAAPLVGTLNSGGSFNQFASLLDLKQSDVAFSWSSTGDGNKIEAGNIAEIRLADKDNADWIMTPIITQSTLNGDWVTKLSSQFGNGDYSAFMQQYRPTDYDLNNPVDSATVAVDFSVNLDTLGLVSADGGTALGLTAGGSTTAGNWIQLNATSSTLPNGTLIAYATDASGNMIARDGSITTSLDAAALGRIGSVASDSGATFFSGEQSIYLPVGQELHFAIVAGNGVVDTTPTVSVTGSGPTLGISVSDSFGRINLTAQVDNTLSESATLAASQRLTDHGWIYLTQNAQVGVNLAWSGDYVNTLHFVRIDVNPADATQWQVGGVAYGDTDAFRNAVQSNWEFMSTQGHSTGTANAVWSVQGDSGYYAPVLVTPDGMWMLNNSATSTANSDGRQHVRTFGENVFGFEDTIASKGADFDYNDMIVKLTML
ncbi:hypothetical protein [Reyranella sp.]|uniref:beta strand repeat-containing protein n=1 Tax=Reyranella sp. TaxID=1929291 RepID=UPI0025F1429D|nr:hypothetical protein [Reyranella sp.]